VSALEIAADVRAGRRRAGDVLDEYLDRVTAREADIHAFLHLDVEGARAAADAVDERVARGDDPGPLAGVPVALKDNLCTRGVPTTCASRILEGWRPPYTANAVKRIVDRGAVVIG
jgi:aspartyl-tRNA(Asn)/glutamyl-tRNA(Gln) amidotransferase subunit A